MLHCYEDEHHIQQSHHTWPTFSIVFTLLKHAQGDIFIFPNRYFTKTYGFIHIFRTILLKNVHLLISSGLIAAYTEKKSKQQIFRQYGIIICSYKFDYNGLKTPSIFYASSSRIHRKAHESIFET